MKIESIPFEIAYCSSFDNNYEPEQLVGLNFENDFIIQNKSHRGWQTKKNPEYPQDLIVQLKPGMCRISKVEILSHHYKIASQIELFTGITKEKEQDSLYIQFTRLGFVNLDNNNRFQDRELKSIKIQADCEYIRLFIKGCYENRLNTEKQVGFLALNILGSINQQDQIENIVVTEPRTSPILYDIDFNLESWIQVIRNAEDESAQDEDFKEAKIYKELGDRLTGLWKFLINLENEKQHAISAKDYDEAEKIKADMLQVKETAENLLKQSGIQINSEGDLLPYDIDETSSIDTLDQDTNENQSKFNHTAFQQQHSDQLLEEAIANWTSFDALSINKMKATSSTSTHQSARLPINTAPTKVIQEQPIEDPETIPEPLTEDDREYCELPISLFGENMISCIMSVKVKCRQNGLNQLSQLIELESFKDPVDMDFVQATLIMLQEAIMDSRESIFNQTLQSWKDLHELVVDSQDKTLYGWIEKFFTRLVSRTNDSNPGIKSSATKTVLELVQYYHDLLLLCLKERMIRNLKDAKARIDLITFMTKHFLIQQWKKDTQLYRQPLMTFIVTYTKHPHADIQKLTWELLMSVATYQQKDTDFKAISSFLDNETTKKLQLELRKKLKMSTSTTAQELRALAVKSSSTTKKTTKKKATTTPDTQRNTTTKKKVAKEKKKPVIIEEEEEKSNICIFCDEKNDGFNEDTLISHYYNYCPVLTNCSMCKIILEVSTLDEHLLVDCEKKHLLKQCSDCKKSIPVEQWLQHTLKKNCIVTKQGESKCPFCQIDMTEVSESGWKSHLIHKCTKNPRQQRK